MIIVNWPDKCEACGNARLEVSSKVKTRLFVRGAQGEAPVDPGTVHFRCRSDGCGNAWTQPLLQAAPLIATKDPTTMSVLAVNKEEAEVLLALDDEYAIYPLAHLVRRGAERIKYVATKAAEVRRQSPRSSDS